MSGGRGHRRNRCPHAASRACPSAGGAAIDGHRREHLGRRCPRLDHLGGRGHLRVPLVSADDLPWRVISGARKRVVREDGAGSAVEDPNRAAGSRVLEDLPVHCQVRAVEVQRQGRGRPGLRAVCLQRLVVERPERGSSRPGIGRVAEQRSAYGPGIALCAGVALRAGGPGITLRAWRARRALWQRAAEIRRSQSRDLAGSDAACLDVASGDSAALICLPVMIAAAYPVPVNAATNARIAMTVAGSAAL